MKFDILMPDYKHCILNLITSILKNYGVETKYQGLEKVDQYLKKSYKNIVLVVLDGMGENILKECLPNGLFAKHKIDTITSVYPSTTTAAMTTYYAGKPPIETGWLGWSQYFKEYGTSFDVLKETDSYTGEKLDVKNLKIWDIIGYKTIYEQIEEQNPSVKTFEIMPEYCAKKAKRTMTANTIEQMCESIVALCKNPEEKFVMVYSDNPDGILHKYGCHAEEVKNFMMETEKSFEEMLQELQGTNTLLVICADHGHQDIDEVIDLLEIDELQDCLLMPPTLEPRMTGFFVKLDKKQEFEKIFQARLAEKFKLFSKEELLESQLFGNGQKHKKVEDFLGDYVAISIADARMVLGTYLSREKKKTDEQKSTHCGLTKNEMEVPLIVFEM